MLHETEKKRAHIPYRQLIAALVLFGLLVPAVFTMVQMGMFSEEPTVDTPVKATSPTAPVLRVATDYDFCPNSYINENGELSGLYVEIVTELANRLGMKPEFHTGEWLDCRQMLTDGKVDVLLGLEIFSNMEGTLRTIPICADDLRVYGRDSIDSAAALADKRVALMARSVIEATYDLQCEYLEYYTNTEILQAVEDGEADYAICHAAVASKIIEKNGLHLTASLPIAKSYPALAVDDSRPELKEKLNDTLKAMSVDGTIGRLENKWITEFTRNRSFGYVLKTNELFYITFGFGVFVVIVIFVAFMLFDRRRAQYITSLLDYQRQLKETSEEAQRASRTKSVFLSHMSHDIRTPLNGITGMVSRIRRNRDNPQVVDDCLDKIDAASGHLFSLLNDVLDMSALEQGSVKAESRAFSLSDELDSIRMIVAQQAEEKGVSIAVHADGVQHSCLVGSPLHLRRILLNLITNGIKYNKPNGRIDITIEERPQDGTHAVYRFAVQDTGIGMSREYVEKHLFQPFTQENDNVRTVYQGTGLGMSIVHGLVKLMGGTISVQSEQGVGTTFTVELPFAFTTEPQQAEKRRKTAGDITGMRVLVVEDNELNREIAQCTLEDAGAQVVTAEDGRQAVETFAASKEGAFDAVLMDVMMPVMDGIAAAKEIRRMKRADAATVPIIAMTANAFNEDRRRTFEAGMNEHLTKPMDAELLRSVLAKYYHPKK